MIDAAKPIVNKMADALRVLRDDALDFRHQRIAAYQAAGIPAFFITDEKRDSRAVEIEKVRRAE